MKHYLKLTLQTLLYWLGLFFIHRFIFFLHLSDRSEDASSAFIHAMRLDISMAAYLSIIPIFFMFLNSRFKIDISVKLMNAYFFIILLLISIIELSSIPIFDEWENTIDSRAIEYLKNPSDALMNIQLFFNPLLALLFALIFVLFYWIGKRLNQIAQNYNFTKPISILPFSILLIVLFLLMRGGLQKIPIKVTSAFYSKSNSSNFIAVNKSFYFLKSALKNASEKLLKKSKSTDYKFVYESLFSKSKNTTTQTYLNSSKPNIVLIILEGWPADIVRELGGIDDVTPGFSQLIKGGILFDQAYTSGFRTDQGFLSILSAVPSFSNLNILTDLALSKGFPSLFNNMSDLNYETLFLYGGDPQFSNMKRYLLNNKIDRIIGQYDFDYSKQSTSWGVPDEFLFTRSIEEINQAKSPFFATILTSSSHNPFDIPAVSQFGDDNDKSKFMSSVYYTDTHLLKFLEMSKIQSWYKNTLFIILADHGSKYLGTFKINEHERYNIPFLIYGDVIKDSLIGTRNSTIINQYDLANTILGLIDQPSSEFPFSTNILADSSSTFAYWSRNNFSGYISKERQFVYQFKSKKIQSSSEQLSNENSVVTEHRQFLELLSHYIKTKSVLE